MPLFPEREGTARKLPLWVVMLRSYDDTVVDTDQLMGARADVE